MALTYHYVTTTGADDKSGGDWAHAMDLAAFYTDFGTVAAGDVYVFAGGTYNLTADITSTTDGTATDPIVILGVTAGTTHEGSAITASDFATGANRPLFTDGGSAYGFTLDDYCVVMNIIIESTDTYALRADSHCVIRNNKVTQNYTDSASRFGIYCGSGGVSGTGGVVIDCEVTGPSCSNGIYASYGTTILFNYIHDLTAASTIGAKMYNSGCPVLFNIFDNCVVGLDSSNDHGFPVFGNTFYDCETGFQATGDCGKSVINNVFSSCGTDALKWTTANIKVNTFMYNHFYNNADDYDGIIADGDAEDTLCDFWDTSGDPLFTTAGSNFSLQASSPCIDAGLAMRLGVGA